MQHDFGVRCRLTDGAGGDDLAAQRQAVGEIAVMGNGDAADFQFGKQWLDVAQRDFAGRGIARMADRDRARQFGQRCRVGIVIADEAHALFGVELLAVEGDDAGRFLSAMLQRVQAKGRQRRCIRVPENAEHAAFFVQRVAIHIIFDFCGSQMGHRCWPLC